MKKINIKKMILNNLWIKILALILSIILWILINSINDPIKYMTITNVQVKLVNTSMITDQGEVYTVLDNTDVVPVVTVKARRSVIEELEKDDIYATANIENLTSVNTVEIEYYSSKYNSDIDDIDGSIENVLLSIEPKMTDIFTLEATTSGEVAEGYELDNVSLEQNQVRVSGPESVVSSIVRAEANVEIEDATEGISTYADIKLYDADGNEVDTDSLTMNITQVKVTVTIMPLKTVPIEVQTSGTPAEGYVANGVVSIDPESVTLAGRSTALENLDSIVISGDAVNIDQQTSSLQTSVDLIDYLPDGVTLGETDFDGTVSITIGIEKAETAEFEVGIDDIDLENIPTGYKAKITFLNDGENTIAASEDEDSEEEKVAIQLMGLSSLLDTVHLSILLPCIDVEELTKEEEEIEGVYTAIVSVEIPEGLVMNNTLTASVEVVPYGTSFPSDVEEEAEEEAEDEVESSDESGSNTEEDSVNTVEDTVSSTDDETTNAVSE